MRQVDRGLSLAAAAAAALLVLAGCAEREVILEGERFDPRAALAASVPTEEVPAPVDAPRYPANQAVAIALPPAGANADWPQRAGNARHLPPHGALSAAPQRVWTVNIGAGNQRRQRIAAAPVVAGGRVFAMDSANRVTAVATSGGALWTADVSPNFDGSTALAGGGLAFGDGRLFATTGAGELIALDPATGGILWRQRLDAPVGGAPTVDGGTVYVVTRDGAGWAVAAADGRVQWTIPGTRGAAGTLGSAAPAIDGDNVLFPYSSGEVVAAARSDGALAWIANVAGDRRGRVYAGVGDITGDPVVAGATTFIGNQGGRTVAVSSTTGARQWVASEGALGPVLPVGGSLFLISDEARLIRLDAATGAVVWQVEMPFYEPVRRERKRAAITAHYGPVLAGGRIVVASGDGVLRLFDPASGSLVGQVEVPGGAAAAPALAGGLLFVVAGNGQLHAFR